MVTNVIYSYYVNFTFTDNKGRKGASYVVVKTTDRLLDVNDTADRGLIAKMVRNKLDDEPYRSADLISIKVMQSIQCVETVGSYRWAQPT